MFKNALKEILNIANSNSGSSYRQKAIDNAPSNNGWYKCTKCGKSYRKADMDADHILPRKHGGSDAAENMQLICKHCNRSKGASTKDTAADYKANAKNLKENRKVQKDFLKKMF